LLYEASGFGSGYSGRDASVPATISEIAAGGAPAQTGVAGGEPTPSTEKASVEDPNISWRLATWQRAFGYASTQPAFGVGFGHLDLLSYGVAPHNSFLTFLFETGAAGLATFAGLCLSFYSLAFRALWRRRRVGSPRVLTLVLLNLSILLMSLFNVVLEGPYMGMFFWITVGLLGLAIATEHDSIRSA
jgi:O-antigen ligase